jgi:hypothetical protein
MGVPGGPYGKNGAPEMCVKKAEKAPRLFQNGRKKVRKIKKIMDRPL